MGTPQSEPDSELQQAIHKCFTDTQMENDDELTLFDTEETKKNLYQLIKAREERLVREARVDENQACQSIVRSKWGTNDQLWEMQERIQPLTQQSKEQQ